MLSQTSKFLLILMALIYTYVYVHIFYVCAYLVIDVCIQLEKKENVAVYMHVLLLICS